MNSNIKGDDLTPAQLAAAMKKFDGATKVASTQGDKLHLFVKGPKKDDGTICGWMMLDERPAHFYFDLIYFFPTYRKGPYVPALLHAVKAVLKKPIYFPPDSVLYKDGSRLLRAIAKRAMAQITVIHADGSREELKQTTELKRTDALLLEDVLPLILTIPTDLFGAKARAIVSVFEGDSIIGPAEDRVID